MALNPQIIENLRKLIAASTVSAPVLEQHQPPFKILQELNQILSPHYVTFILALKNYPTVNLLAIDERIFQQLINHVQQRALNQDLELESVLAHSILLSGHLDVVPYNVQKWHSSPTELTIKDDKIYGRGSTDMKGFLATALTFAQEKMNKLQATTSCPQNHASAYLPSLLFTSDEETSMNGALLIDYLFKDNQESTTQSHANNSQVSKQAQTKARTQEQEPAQAQDLFANELLTDENIEIIVNRDLNSYNLLEKLAQVDKSDIGPYRKHCLVCAQVVKDFMEQSAAQASFTGCHLSINMLRTLFKLEQFKLIVIGEPTEMNIVYRHKGWMAYDISFSGKPGHSSQPERGINVMGSTANTIYALNNYITEVLHKNTADIEPSDRPTLNLGTIQGGTSVNTICDKVNLCFDVRPTPEFDPLCVHLTLQDYLYRHITLDKGVTYNLSSMYPPAPPYAFPNMEELNKIQALVGTSLQSVSYCTEAPFVAQLGPTIIMGPGNIKQAHGHNEYIECSQLEKCYNILEELFTNLEQL